METVDHSALFREYLAASNISGIRRLWKHVAPHLPQPTSDFDVQVMMHSARTQAESMDLSLRIYSHQWLLANDLPSQLPDHLKPVSERFGYNFRRGVGIAVMTDDPAKVEAAKIIRRAMGEAVEDAFASGKTETAFLRKRIDEARDNAIRGLGRPQVKVNFNGLH